MSVVFGRLLTEDRRKRGENVGDGLGGRRDGRRQMNEEEKSENVGSTAVIQDRDFIRSGRERKEERRASDQLGW